MYINRLARNQLMMYNFISRSYDNALPSQTSFSPLNALSSAANSKPLDTDSLLEKMGMSGLEGRTVREMAKYKLENQTAPPSDTGLNTDLAIPQFSTRPQYIPLSEEATAAAQELALQDARSSVEKGSSPNAEDRAALIQKHLQNVPSSQRAAAFNTMNKVWESELDRIGEHIKKNDPSWNYWGDAFDTSILDNYEPGVNIWV